MVEIVGTVEILEPEFSILVGSMLDLSSGGSGRLGIIEGKVFKIGEGLVV